MRPLLAVAFVLGLAGCGPAGVEPAPQTEHALDAALEALLAREPSGTAELPGMLLTVKAPEIGLDWSGATGVAELDSRAPLGPDYALRIASVTKTFVAAAVLRLVEDGRLALDEAIAGHLLPASRGTLRTGGYDPQAITVRMLLGHTSGLHDYATHTAFFERIMADPAHHWSRAEQLELAVTEGSPYGAPGTVYHYSDTGYILLGEILETVTARPMPVAVRELLDFEKLGLTHTWFETLEAEPAGAPPRAHQYQDDIDATTIHPSVDLFGGGGLVSTLSDLSKFYRALLHGEVLRPDTLADMLAASPLSLADGRNGYGLGIHPVRVGEIECYGHGGYWGVVVWHCPGVDSTVASAVTNTAGVEILRTLQHEAVTLVAGAVEAHRGGR